MASSIAGQRRVPSAVTARSAASLLRTMGFFLTSLLLLTAVWLVIRRFGGAFQQPLSPEAMCLLAAVLGGLPFAVRRRSGAIGRDGTGPTIQRVLLLIASLLIGIAVTLPGSHTISAGAFWAVVLSAQLWAWLPIGRRIGGAGARANPDRSAHASTDIVEDGRVEHKTITRIETTEDFDDAELEDDGLLPADVSQQITRAKDAAGGEIVFGTIRCSFETGQRQQSVHLAFCPPLEAIANVTMNPLSGPDVRIKTTLVETYGVGLEVKLPQPSAEPVDVQIQFFAFERSDDVESS